VCPRCLAEGELAPARLGDALELIEEIGRGGMGTVWKARHLALDRIVAVKFLAERLAGHAEATRRFEREAQALARLSHPGIVAVHDFGREGDRAFIVMEYVEGVPLSALVPLPPEQARDVARQVLDALAYAHARGVVHRDVKPDNILVEASGHVKVSDFGVARILDPEDAADAATTAGRVLGTPVYMAPEALAGAPPDPRMDVYSVGVVLHELLTGRRPAGDTPPLTGPFEPVVRRALALDPAQRYGSAALMRDDLARLPPPTAAAADGLPAEERHWLQATALVQTLATSAALWAFLVSVTPRMLSPGDLQPLVMMKTGRLADGRLYSWARFETWPALAAVALVGLAVAAQGLLRHHWRRLGLERATPDRPLPESRRVLACGLTACVVYVAHRLLEPVQATVLWAYVPIVGGLIELFAVFLAWMAVLEAWRTRRALTREAGLWLGLGLGLVPPVVDLVRYLRSWPP
jgi:serine/threonine-protein kinase